MPFVGVSYAIADFIWMHRWGEIAYVQKHEKYMFFLPFRGLNPVVHCSESVSRNDLEIVAESVAQAHASHF